ncbi:acyl-CoA synthetase family protein [Stutzerimonas nitrititolerans]|uniref:Acyl-CoA synthetase family protein n=1 Tax=Stutzerimonas nitrititolerans TaxID=2482751 RepID=A0AA42BFJ4_9GAMM|nr:acyl-CoA synthetase family protein [Stutzerimonas nitrititolerans]MCO7546324.1 acyl-CoA synthetase family protein [Stutzerimonas nitrititolerans]SUD83251.1 AMP-dependent synthetase/ligase [Stutzerimonas stutzeri]
MNWIALDQLLEQTPASRPVALGPVLEHEALRQQALRLAGGLGSRNITRLALHLEDAGELAIALLGAWRAGVTVLLPADLQPATRQRLADQADLWLTDEAGDSALAELLGEALPAAPLDLDQCRLLLCTSGSSGEPKLIEKHLRQLANEVEVLEDQWGAELGQACIIGSVAAQHIYGLLFRVLWPLCAGRPLLRRTLPFPEDIQLASREQADFCLVASPALLKRMGDNLDWPALSRVRRVFSSGGPLPAEAAQQLQQRLDQAPTEIYGSSETGGIAWRQGGSLWQPFVGVELSQDEQGALRIASPCLPPDHVEQTADAARIQADGRFELLGRLDRIVKLEEKRISLPMLESALSEHPFVSEARLSVIEDNRAFLAALVALSDAGLHALRNQGRRALTQALRKHLAQYCEALALPRRWRLVRQMPCNAQGKLPQAQLEALLRTPRSLTPERLGERQEDDQWHLELGVPVDLAHFSGHFPQTPVLPGVVQIDWAISLARQLIENLPPRFQGMEVLKFQQLARPGDRLQLTLRFDAQRSKLHFSYRNGDAPCSSGRILLGAPA